MEKQSVQTSNRAPELISARKRAYLLVTLLLPFVILAFVEIGLRVFHYGDRPALFVSIPNEQSKYYGINVEVAKRYFTKLSDVPTPRKDLFLKEKPKNGYRIFILGESTAAGFPYGNNVTFPRILHRRLVDTFPEKHIEVVNTGMTAINSYAQLDFMDEILQYEPDAILIYSGHNEYYGALGVGSMEAIGKNRWIVNASLALQHFRVYEVMRQAVDEIGKLVGLISTNEEIDPSATLMERIVEKKIIPLGSNDYESGKSQFRENISSIIRKAKEAGVKVLISELASNIRDNEPFESVVQGNLPSARDVYNDAIQDARQEKYDEAKTALYFAKDLDALRFRAPEEFNTIIHDVAAEHNVPVVPMKSYFESSSPYQLIGNNLMLDHVHPTFDGYFLMADAFFNSMKDEKFISDEWQDSNIKPSSYYRRHWGFTPLDSVHAALHIMRLKGGWPFKKQQGPNLALAYHEPTSKIESVAANILTSGKLTLEQGHIELAKYYESRGEPEKAFDEYNALMYTVPYFELFYQLAAKTLVEVKNYDKALEVLDESLKYQETAFAYQWIGQIYLMRNETDKGIEFLEKAKALGVEDDVLLYNLARAYFTTAQWKQGDDILNRLRTAGTADRSLISMLEAQRKSSYELGLRPFAAVQH